MKIWTTEDGKEIPYAELEDSHILNIERFVRRRADEGVQTMGGDPADIDSMWEETIEGDEVFEYFDYRGIMKEITNRKLTPLP